jgi:hypothetical protein
MHWGCRTCRVGGWGGGRGVAGFGGGRGLYLVQIRGAPWPAFTTGPFVQDLYFPFRIYLAWFFQNYFIRCKSTNRPYLSLSVLLSADDWVRFELATSTCGDLKYKLDIQYCNLKKCRGWVIGIFGTVCCHAIILIYRVYLLVLQ